MSEEKTLREDAGLDDDALDAVLGGTADPAAPVPTGGVTYTCTKCGHVINASTRDMTVTCPNMKCRCAFQVKQGKLVLL